MKIWLKRILITLVVVLIVALVSIAIFLLTFDPNAYKSKLEEAVYSRYQRTLSIEGEIQLSLFPRIGLSVSDVSLSDRDSTERFASVDNARFAVAIWPLMSNRLVVDHVAVTGFKAWLVRDEHGRFNFSDLAGYTPVALEPDANPGSLSVAAITRTLQAPEPPVQTEPEATATQADQSTLSSMLGGPAAAKADMHIDIAGLELKNGEIHFRDAATGTDLRIVQLDVNTGRVTFDQAFDVAIKGNILGDQPVADATLDAQAIVKLDPVAQTYSAQRINLNINGDIGQVQARTAFLRGNLAYSAFSQMLNASNIEMQLQGELNGPSPVKGLNSSLTVSQLKVDRGQALLQLDKLAFRAKGNWPDQRFDAALDAPAVAISPDSAQGGAVTGTLKIDGGPNVLGLSMGLSGMAGNASQLNFKELRFEGGLKRGDRLTQLNLVSPASWRLFEEKGGLSAIKGDVRIEDATLPDGNFQFPFIGSMQADLFKDELSTDINAVLNGGKIDFKLSAKQLAQPKIVFDLGADKLDLSSLLPSSAAPVPPQSEDAPAQQPSDTDRAAASSAPAAAASPAVDFSFLNSLDVSGKLAADELIHKDFKATGVAATVLARDGKLDVSGIKAALYQGTLTGRFKANASNQINAEFAAKGIDVGPLLTALANESRLLGKGALNAKLETQGTTVDALKAGLAGTLTVGLRDGAVRGLNVAQTLREAHEAVRNLFSGQLPDVATRFDTARQTDFSALDSQIEFLQGQGTVKKLSLVSPLLRVTQGVPATIDMVNQQIDLLIKVKVVNTKTGQGGKELADLKGITVPMRISGPFKSLGYQVQWEDIGSNAIKQAVKDGLLDVLSQQTDNGGGPATDKANAEKADRVKSIGEALKGLLGQ